MPPPPPSPPPLPPLPDPLDEFESILDNQQNIRRVPRLSTRTSNKVIAEVQGETIAITDAGVWRSTICDRLLEIADEATGHQPQDNQIIKYLRQNHLLIEKLLDADNTPEAVRILRDDVAFSEMLLCDKNFYQVADALPIPSLDACLKLKDELGITDRGWTRLADTFRLPKERRLYQLISYRRKSPSPHRTTNGRGYTYYLRDMIRHAIITESIPPSADIPLGPGMPHSCQLDFSGLKSAPNSLRVC